MKSVNLHRFGEIIRFTIKNNLKQSILGLGAPGLGKSELVAEIAKEFGYRLVDLRLAQMSEVEIGGLIYPSEDKTKTTWLKPDYFPTEDDPKTILLLDEITSCSKRVQVAAYQLVLDRKIGKHVLPESTIIIALGNREDDEGVYVQLAAPLANRFNIYQIDLDADVWLNDYAYKLNEAGKPNINPLVSSFIYNDSKYLHTQAENPDSMTFASPRSWKRVSDIIDSDNSDGDLSDVAMDMISGCLDDVTANEFCVYCKNSEEFSIARKIVEGNEYKMPEDKSVNIFVIGAIISIMSTEFEKEYTYEAMEKRLVSIFGYLNKLEPEIAAICVSSFVKTDPDLVNKFMAKHPDLYEAYVKTYKFINELDNINGTVDAANDSSSVNSSNEDVNSAGGTVVDGSVVF